MTRTVLDRLRTLFSSSTPNRVAEESEQDVAADPALVSSRATGGQHDTLTGDRGSVTGTGNTGVFVGRIAGDDLGYAGETGAERRADAARHKTHGDPGGSPVQ